MGLKERLLLLITPLVTLPVIMGAVFLLAASRDTDILYWLPRFKITILFLVLGILLVTVLIIAGVSRSLTLPITLLAKDAKKISHGELEHNIEIAANFSEMRDLVGAIEQMKHELKRRDEMIKEEAAFGAVGRLASQVAHDLRTPLQSLIVFTESSRKLADGKFAEYQAIALRSAEKINSMADEMLNYVKAGRVERTRVDMATLLNEVVADAKVIFLQNTDIEIASEISGKIIASLDKQKIERVLTNLLSNAVQAMLDGTGNLSLNVTADAKDLVIEISDTGNGIAADDIQKIFEPSFTKGKRKGTGLGLAYSKNVIEAHGGTISVQSEVGRGSVFTIRLPECMVEEKGDCIVLDATKNSETIPPKIGSVLIADDDFGVRLKLVEIIGRLGGTVACAATGPDELMNDGEFDYSGIDAAIVDYHYEGGDKTGIDLIAFLKNKGVTNVHLCTAFHGDEDIAKRAILAGALSVIAKPVNEEEVKKIFT